MHLAITGAAGFIGARVTRDALAAGHRVLAQLRPSHDGGELRAAGARLLPLDLGVGRGEALARGLDGVDAVIHCAARVRWGSEAEFERDGVRATEELLDAAAAAGVRRVVHVSSTAVYGDRAVELGPLDEDAPFGRRMSSWDRYARAKIAAEERAARAPGGLEVVVLRPGWVLGEGHPTVTSLLRALGGPAFPLFGRGHNRLPLVYVGSVAAACLLAAERPEAAGRAYNVACEWEITQRAFFLGLAAAAGLRPRLLPLPFRLFYTAGFGGEVAARLLPGFEPPLTRTAAVLLGRDAVIRTERIRRELGWRPADLDDVLARLAR